MADLCTLLGRMRIDFRELQTEHPAVKVLLNESNMFKWIITFDHTFKLGPNVPAQKKQLVMLFTFPYAFLPLPIHPSSPSHFLLMVHFHRRTSYPMDAPQVKLEKPFYHLNVEQDTSMVRIKVLQKWLPSYSASYLLKQIIAVLDQPEAGCATPEMEEEYLSRHAAYLAKLQASLLRLPASS